MAKNLEKEHKGPRGHHFLVISLNVVLGLLLYWFLGFIMDDIADQPGPQLSEIQKKYQDPKLVKEKEELDKSTAKLTGVIAEQRAQQTLMQTSTDNYRDTMNQLLGLQKSYTQKGGNLPTETEKKLENMTDLYLKYQGQTQDINASLTKLNLDLQQLQNKARENDDKLAEQNKEAYKGYETQLERHNLVLAAWQLLILIPLLLIVAYLFKKHRQSLYKSMLIAAGIAIFVKMALVMHEYFPSYIFKYLLVLALIYVTIMTLLTKLRMEAKPKPDWLQKQYREAYQKNQCPMCQFAIKPSIAKFFTKTTEMTPDHSYLNQVEAYTCPCCGELLFEKCSKCTHVRHALLTYCDNCGMKKEV